MAKGRYDDLSAVLFLVPILVSGGYGIYLWVAGGITPILPSNVYLTVTRDPFVFAAGSLAVFLGLIADVAGVQPAERRSRLQASSVLIQKLAVATFVLAILMAWYANGFTDAAGAVSDFMVGRFSIVFPFLLVLFSYVVTIPLKWRALARTKTVGMIVMLVVPAVVYEVGKRNASAGLGIAFLLLIVGAYLFLRKEKQSPAKPA